MVVGMGASAGGIKAFKRFLEHTTADSGIAYVAILHLAPDYESRLAEILQTAAHLPVTQVNEDVELEPNHVYVIPPGRGLTISDDLLLLSETTGTEQRRASIDRFFRSLAEAKHARAACVLLSGTGADGSLGLERVKELGGFTVVQEPSEAEYDEMPVNAIATGHVDVVLPVAEIPARILAYKQNISHVRATAAPVETNANVDELVDRIFAELRSRMGHDLTSYSRPTLLRRIARRVTVHGLADLPAYVAFLRTHPEEPSALLNDLLIGVTDFFRDANAFRALGREVVPRLFEGKEHSDQVRVWVPGCATGQEAYSIAMLLAEHAAELADPPSVQVFASDIDEHAIAAARNGFYRAGDLEEVPPERMRRFFVKETTGYRIRADLRETVLFAVHNLLRDPPFSHLDLVTCRNVLIYYDRTAQDRILESFHFALNPGGYLFLGASESRGDVGGLFTLVNKEHRIYQSRVVGSRSRFYHIELPPVPQVDQLATSEVAQLSRAARTSLVEVHQRLLEEYAPPSILVDQNYEILHLSDHAGRYLEFRGGEPTHNLLNVARNDLRPALRSALAQAVQKQKPAGVRGVTTVIEGRPANVTLIVRPIFRDEALAQGCIMVLFKEESRDTESEPIEVIPPGEPIARHLEEEIERLKTQLRSTTRQHEHQHENLRASNEELQASLEELQTTTEELQTSKEELQAVNEELKTVNQELKSKVEEATEAANDFQNLITSADIGTIFLDRELRVKLFTPRARELFNLLQSDVNRRLADLSSNLVEGDVLADARYVLETLQPVVREWKTRDGRWYEARVRPYQTAENRTNGVVVVFFDVTGRRHDAQEREALLATIGSERSLFEAAVREMSAGVVITDAASGRVLLANELGERLWRSLALAPHDPPTAGEAESLQTRGEGLNPAEQPVRRALARGEIVQGEQVRFVRGDGVERFYLVSSAPVHGVDRTAIATMTNFYDITDGLQTRDELERRVAERTAELAKVDSLLQSEIAVRRQAEDIRRELVRGLVTAQDEERLRIARELHDEMGQQVTSLSFELKALEGYCSSSDGALQSLRDLQQTAYRLDQLVERLVFELRPISLDDHGLDKAFATQTQAWSLISGIPVDLHCSGFDGERLAPDLETTIYRILQETLTNVRKHSGAQHVSVILERRSHYLQLIVEDDGHGFDASRLAAVPLHGHRVGLLGMRERIEAVDGTLTIESSPGSGCSVFVRVPLRARKREEGRNE